MAVIVKGRNTVVSPAVKAYVEKKIDKVTRQFKAVGDITAVLKVENGNHIAEITVPAKGILLRAQESTKDMYSSIDLVVEKIERQVHKYKTKLMKRKYGNFREIPAETASVVEPALVQADSQGIYITLLNDFGTDMGSISYDGFSAQADMAILPSKLKIEYIINDFQNAFYKEEKLRQNLKASKLDFKVLKADEGEDAAGSDSGEIRQVYSGNKLIEEITINSQGAAIKNLLRGYSFSLYFLQ